MFRTATRLVEVDVIVTDGNGRPVPGLTREDFTVAEDRIPQEISVFQVLDGSAARTTAPPVSQARKTPLPFSNHPSGSAAPTMLLIDRVNASWESQWHARRHVEKYLQAVSASDSVALYVLGSTSISVLHDFSTDAASLRRALDRFTARTTPEYDASTDVADDAKAGTLGVWLADPGLAASEFALQRRQYATFEALEVIAAHLSGIAGRKNLVWASEVFPIPARGDPEFMFRLRRSARALSDAQVALYTVDSRGLVGAMSMQAGKARFTTLAEVVGNVETMQFFADETGGRAYANTNDLSSSIRRAVEDTRHRYLVAYRSARPPDGNYRSISVKVRGKGLRLRHRRRYWATAPKVDRAGRDEALRAALQRPLAGTQIRLSAEASLEAATGTADVQLRIDPASLTLVRDRERWTGTLDLLIATVDRRGRATVLRQRTFTLSLTDRERADIRDEGLQLAFSAQITEALHDLRIVVRNPLDGQVGSLIIPRAVLGGNERLE